MHFRTNNCWKSRSPSWSQTEPAMWALEAPTSHLETVSPLRSLFRWCWHFHLCRLKHQTQDPAHVSVQFYSHWCSHLWLPGGAPPFEMADSDVLEDVGVISPSHHCSVCVRQNTVLDCVDAMFLCLCELLWGLFFLWNIMAHFNKKQKGWAVLDWVINLSLADLQTCCFIAECVSFLQLTE